MTMASTCCQMGALALVLLVLGCAQHDSARISFESPNDSSFRLGPSGVRMAIQQSGLLANNEAVKETRLVAWCAKASFQMMPPNAMNEAVILALTQVGDARAHWRILYIQGCCSSNWERGTSSRLMPCERTYDSAPTDAQIAEFIHDSNFGLNECYPDQEVLRICLFTPSKKIRAAVTKGITQVEREERYVSVGEIYFG